MPLPFVLREKYEELERQVSALQKEKSENLSRIVALAASESSLRRNIAELEERLDDQYKANSEPQSTGRLGRILRIAAEEREKRKVKT